MTIPEAVQLVMQAAAIGAPGEALVLDMGEPVRIVDLARQLMAHRRAVRADRVHGAARRARSCTRSCSPTAKIATTAPGTRRSRTSPCPHYIPMNCTPPPAPLARSPHYTT